MLIFGWIFVWCYKCNLDFFFFFCMYQPSCYWLSVFIILEHLFILDLCNLPLWDRVFLHQFTRQAYNLCRPGYSNWEFWLLCLFLSAGIKDVWSHAWLCSQFFPRDSEMKEIYQRICGTLWNFCYRKGYACQWAANNSWIILVLPHFCTSRNIGNLNY